MEFLSAVEGGVGIKGIFRRDLYEGGGASEAADCDCAGIAGAGLEGG